MIFTYGSGDIFETPNLYYIILAAVLTFIVFLIVPTFFAFKNIYKMPLNHIDDNKNIVLEDTDAEKYFAYAKLKDKCLIFKNKEAHSYDITVVYSKNKKKTYKNYKFVAKDNEVLSVDLPFEAKTIGLLINQVDGKIVSKKNRYLSKAAIIISYSAGAIVFAALMFGYLYIESLAFYDVYPDFVLLYLFMICGLIASAVGIILTFAFNKKVRI